MMHLPHAHDHTYLGHTGSTQRWVSWRGIGFPLSHAPQQAQTTQRHMPKTMDTWPMLSPRRANGAGRQVATNLNLDTEYISRTPAQPRQPGLEALLSSYLCRRMSGRWVGLVCFDP